MASSVVATLLTCAEALQHENASMTRSEQHTLLSREAPEMPIQTYDNDGADICAWPPKPQTGVDVHDGA